MTNERDIDRLLDHWLSDGPTEVSDRVVLDVADRIERQQQRPAWRFLRRPNPMTSSARWAAVVVTVALVAVVGFAVLGQQVPSGVGAAPPTPTPPPSTAPSASPTPPWDDSPTCGETGCGGPQTAGTHTSRSLKPAVTYTLTSPWVNVRDWPDYFMLYPDNPGNRALAAAGNSPPNILILPGPIKVSPSARCAGGATTDEVDVNAAGLAEYMASREGLAVTEPIPVTLSGLTGLKFGVGLAPGWTGCTQDVMGEILTAPDSYDLVVLDRPGGGALLIETWRSGGPNQPFWEESGQIVQSFEFDFSQQPSPSP